MNRTIIAFASLAIAAFSFATSAQAQTATDTETFQVMVNPLFSINAPTPQVSQVHDETNNDQVFPTQIWLVTSNNAAGANVTFQTNQAFTHTLDSSYKRDAALALSIASSNAWSVTNAMAQTDYAGSGNEVAIVTAESNRAGAASFALDVRFIEQTFTDLPSGTYEMTVTGTLTAK